MPSPASPPAPAVLVLLLDALDARLGHGAVSRPSTRKKVVDRGPTICRRAGVDLLDADGGPVVPWTERGPDGDAPIATREARGVTT